MQVRQRHQADGLVPLPHAAHHAGRGHRVGPRVVRALQLHPVMGAQRLQGPPALAVLVDVLVDDQRVDDGRGHAAQPFADRRDAVPPAFAVEQRQVVAGVHHHQRCARAQHLGDGEGDLADRRAGRGTVRAGVGGRDAVDRRRLLGYGDARVEQPGALVRDGPVGLQPDDGGGDDVVGLDVGAGGLQVERDQRVADPAHRAAPVPAESPRRAGGCPRSSSVRCRPALPGVVPCPLAYVLPAVPPCVAPSSRAPLTLLRPGCGRGPPGAVRRGRPPGRQETGRESAQTPSNSSR